MELVTARSYRDPIEAHVDRARLEDAGIPSFVWDDQLIAVQWLYSAAVGGAKLKVRPEDRERAIDLLDRDESGDLRDILEIRLPPAQADHCARCGSDRVTRSRLHRRAAAASLFLSFPIIAWRRRWVCLACGHTWKVGREASPPPSPATLEAERAVRGEGGSYRELRLFLTLLLVFGVLEFIRRQIAA